MMQGRGNAILGASIALAVSGLAGCILCGPDNPDLCMTVVNECEEELGELLGYTMSELDLRKSVVRTGEAVAGNLVADAFYFTAKSLCNPMAGLPCPVAAFQNGGGIRSQTACGERELIPVGPLYQRDIRQMLPFDNLLSVVELTGHDLKLALEHSVDLLGQTGKSGQAGHFLQVSRLKFAVDCSQPTQAINTEGDQITTPGARIVPGSLMVRNNDDDANPTWEMVSDTTAHTYPVAMSNFIGAGGDGFVAFVQRDANEKALCETVPCEGDFLDNILYNVNQGGTDLTDSDALSYYVRAKQKVAPYVDGRIELRPTCYTGLQ
ncbi:MAG: 5'-nucleotidase C-terminal domain-containing protein [Deltaproteobacteria bacterium]|nr:5'-nucleotidase C-terminal domain-containing protein [Deltaproteobacteria bacterium]